MASNSPTPRLSPSTRCSLTFVHRVCTLDPVAGASTQTGTTQLGRDIDKQVRSFGEQRRGKTERLSRVAKAFWRAESSGLPLIAHGIFYIVPGKLNLRIGVFRSKDL